MRSAIPEGMRFALLAFLAPLVSTSPALAQSNDRLEPLPSLPATPEAAPAPAAPPASPEPTPVATGGQADTPASTTTVASPCPCGRYRHQGFYLGFGSGFGYMSAWGDGPTGSASVSGLGYTGSVAIGGTIANGLVLGGGIRAWATSGTFNGGPAVTVTTTTRSANGDVAMDTHDRSGKTSVGAVEFGALVDWYPDPQAGWHAGASVGIGGIALTDDAGRDSTSVSLAASLFGGYQWWLGPAWSLGLAGVMSGAGRSGLTDTNQNATGYRMMPLAIGIESLLLYY